MQMIDKVNWVSYGYNPSTEVPQVISADEPDAKPDEEDEEDPLKEMLMYDTFYNFNDTRPVGETFIKYSNLSLVSSNKRIQPVF